MRAAIDWDEMKDEIRRIIRDELAAIRKASKWYKHKDDTVVPRPDLDIPLSKNELERIHKEFEDRWV